MLTFLGSDKYDVRYISPLTEDWVEEHFKLHGQMEDVSPNLNIFEACFTTCWARLSVFEALETLQEWVLYFDTDSVIYQDPNRPSLVLGNYLCNFKDELKFCLGGNKYYSYCTLNGTTICKVRGFSLNWEGSAQMNYDLRQSVIDKVTQPKQDVHCHHPSPA